MPTFLFGNKNGFFGMEPGAQTLQVKVVGEVERIAEDIIRHEELELVAVEYRRESTGWVLRVYIDKDGGVSIGDCKTISRQLADILDAKDVVPYSYRLEVSSPGLNRPLTKEKDFMKYKGETVKLKTLRPINNRRNFKGYLVDFKENSIFLDMDGQSFSIPFCNIEKANLEYNFKKGKQG